MSDLGNKAVMAENIKYYMNLHNKTRVEVCKDLGFAYSTFSEWLNAKKYPMKRLMLLWSERNPLTNLPMA